MIGFDCGSATSNVTTISLTNDPDCNIEKPKIETANSYIALLQLKEYEKVKVYQCLIEIHRVVQSCNGYFNYVKPIERAEETFILEVSAETCKGIHESKTYKYDNNHIITNLKINETKTVSIVFCGSAENNECIGGFYSDSYGTFSHVFVQGHIKITLSQQFATVDLHTNLVRLNSGVSCEFNKYHCMNIQYGHTFWNNLEGKGCISDHYTILYYGFAEKVTDYTNEKNNITTYILNSQHTTFAFKITEQTSICQIIAYRTLHPRILILDNKNTALNQILQNIPVGNTGVQDLDLFTYVNQKFVFTEHHINLQGDKLY